MNHAENERNPGITYERRDLSSRGVLTFLIVLAVAAVLVHVVLWGAYKYVSRHNVQPPLVPATVANDSGTVQPAGNPRATFPAPRLQADPVGDLERFRTAEDAALNSYGWADQANGRVHIPIEQAINLVAQTGLPTRPAALAAADARGKITAGGAGGGGRTREDYGRRRGGNTNLRTRFDRREAKRTLSDSYTGGNLP